MYRSLIIVGGVILAWTVKADEGNYDLIYDGAGGEIAIDETVSATNVQFRADGFVLKGTGMLQAADLASPAPGQPVPSGKQINIAVASGAKAEVGVNVKVAWGANFEKTGDGELVLRDADFELFRTAVYGGTLRFVNATLGTAKIQNYGDTSADSPVALHLDGVTIKPYNNNVILGETDNTFPTATLGAGGLTLTNNPPERPVGEIRLKHHLSGPGGITMNGGYDLRIQSETGAFTGGWNFLSGRSYLDWASGLGSGPVTVDGTARFLANRTMTIDNTIVAGTGKIGLAGTAEKLTLTNLAFTAANVERTVTFTVGEGSLDVPRTVRLALGETPVAIGGINLEKGESQFDTTVSLTADGDVLKATETARAMFISSPDGEAILNVGKDGVTFDTNGADLGLGALVRVEPVEVVEGYALVAAENGDFKDGTTGWEFRDGTGLVSGVYDNDSGFVSAFPEYKTTNETHFAVVRPSASLKKTFTLPEPGEWMVVFDLANRPDRQWDEGNLEWQLEIDGDVVREMAKEEAKHPFARYASPAFAVNAAGETHTFRISTGKPNMVGGHPHEAFLIDSVRFEKVPVVRTAHGALTKTGAGCLTVAGLETSGDVTVEAGALALTQGAFVSNTVTVKAGATIRLADVAEVAIANASFEDVDDTQWTFVKGAAVIPNWTLSKVSTNPNLDVSGWQKNGSVVSSAAPTTTNGTHTAFLRPSSRLSTTVTVPEDGTYTLTFDHSARGGSGTVSWGYLLEIAVKMGDQTICTVPARTAANYGYRTVSEAVELKAGTYTLAFETSDGGEMEGQKVETASGPMVFIDAVSLVKKDLAQPSQEGVVWNFEPGSTIDVSSFDVELEQAFVNGVQIRGGRSAFTAAGVTVLGTGSIRSATPAGTVIVIR